MSAFETRQTHIHICECLAALSAVHCCREDLRGLRLLHFVDNQGALANLIAGASRCRDVAAVVMWYQLICIHANVAPWLEYVETHLNIGDVPSRELQAFVNHALARRLGITSVELASLPPMEDIPSTPPPPLPLLA